MFFGIKPWSELPLMTQVVASVLSLFAFYALISCIMIYIGVYFYHGILMRNMTFQTNILSNDYQLKTLKAIVN